MRSIKRIDVSIFSPFDLANRAIAALLTRQSDMAVVGTSLSPAGALLLARESDVLLIHHALPDVLLARTISAVLTATEAHVIVLGVPADVSELTRLYEQGIHGYVQRGWPTHDLLDIVRAVASEGLWIEPRVLQAALARYLDLNQRYAKLRAAS